MPEADQKPEDALVCSPVRLGFVFDSRGLGPRPKEPQMVAVSSLFRRDLKRDNLTGGGGGGQDTKKAPRHWLLPALL